MRRSCRSAVAASVVLVMLLAAAVYAQSDTAWLFRYPGRGQGHYQPLASFVDDTGNVYVAGWSGEEDSLGFFLIKIDSAGRLVWVRTHDGMAAVGAARDRNGNIYISCGATGGRICLLKYKPDGDLEWTRSYSEKGKHHLALGSIALDDSQNVYACGAAASSHGSRAGEVVRLVKCRPNGDMASVRGYTLSKDLSLNDGEFHILGNGDAYLVLSVEHPVRYNDWLIVKLSREGQVLWKRVYKDTGDKWDCPRWSQVDEKANIYITGDVITAAGKHAFCTMKMDSSGNAVWIREYERQEHLSSGDPPRFLRFSNGNVYVVAGEEGITLVKYDSAGNQEWASKYAGYEIGYGWDGLDLVPSFCSMNVDDLGNVYLTGSGYSRDWFGAMLKYDQFGNRVWVKLLQNREGECWTGATVLLDKKGALYDVGIDNAADNSRLDIYVLKYRTR